nr:uncharacterized protein LOC113741048 [Coffea arabica]
MRQFGYPQRIPMIQGLENIRLNTVAESRSMVLEAWGNLLSLESLHLDQVNKLEPKVISEYNEWIKLTIEQSRKKSQSAPVSPEEQIDKLKKELEDYQLQLIVADHALEDARAQLKWETRKTEKLERALDAFDKIREGIRKLSIGRSKESQRTSLARHEDFVKMVNRTINEAIFFTIATQRSPIITRSRSRALRQPVNMSSMPEASERSAMVTSPDFTALGAQLSEVLDKFNDLSVEMAAQRLVIDQLVTSNSGGGVPNDREPVDTHPHAQDNQPPHTSNAQTTFLPSFANPLENTFTQLNSDLSYTHPNYILINPTSNQIPQTHPQTNLNVPPNPQEPHHHVAAPFVLDTAAQGKAAVEEQPVPIDKDLLRRLDRFDDFMKKNQGLSRHSGLDYDELCLFPDIQLPLGFKTPKFSKYDGTGNPKTHLKMFANKLGKPVDDENLPMRLFPESLEGDALDWYSNLKSGEVKTWLDLSTAFVKQYEFNCELAPTRTTLEGTKRKPSEDHKTYAKRWRKLAAKVEPPMTDEEIVRTFIKAHDPPYFEEIFRMTGSSFAAIINKLEEYDEFVKAGKIVNVSTLKLQLDALQNQSNIGKKSQFKKKEGETAFIWDQGPSFRPKNHPIYSVPYQYYTNAQPVYHATTQLHHSRPSHLNTSPLPPTPQPIFQNHSRPNYYPRPTLQNNNPSQNPFQTREVQNQRQFRTFTNLGRPIDQLYEQLRAAGKISTVPPKLYPRGPPDSYDPQAICAYHSGSPGHTTCNCWALKHKIQDMIDSGDIVLRRKGEQGPNVSKNPLPEHGNTVGVIIADEDCVDPTQYIVDETEVFGVMEADHARMRKLSPVEKSMTKDNVEGNLKSFVFEKEEPFIAEGGVSEVNKVPFILDLPSFEWDVSEPEEVPTIARFEKVVKNSEIGVQFKAKDNSSTPKPLVSEKEAVDFLKMLKRSEYKTVEQLDRMSTQISFLNLLLTSELHREALLKILNEAQVPKDIPVDKFSNIVGNVLAANHIAFSDDDLTVEGIGHNRALYISVRCNGKLLPRVLVDNGSALNICPWNTLTKLGFLDIKLRPSATVVRGFDSSKRESMGEVDLVLEIGPAQFQVTCQVMDFSGVYNILLGRPWIHASNSVPSSLHQILRFIANDQLITVFAEDDCTMIVDAKFNGENRQRNPISAHHVADIVSVGWASRDKSLTHSDLPEASIMMAREMIRGGYEIGKGLGRELQGILEPIEIPTQKDTFGLGFHPTAKDRKEMQARKQAEKKGKQTALNIPPLYHTFPRPSEVIMPETKNFVEEIEVDLSQLFVGAIDEEEPSENLEFLPIIEGAIQNWTADYFPSRREFRFVLWPQIKPFDPLDVTILEFDGCNLDISHELEIMQSEIQNESDNEEEFESVSRDLIQYEEKSKPNLEETEIINIGTKTEVKEVKVSIHLNKKQKEEMIEFLMLFQDVFAWSYDDMPGISTDIVVHRLPIDPNFLPVKQKPRKFKPEMSLKIKEQVVKQLNAKIIMVSHYPTWLSNPVPVPKKSGEVRVCVDYRDLNKASPKDDFPLPNIHILLDNTAGHEIESFGDCFAGYHQILMAEENREKTSFITPWGTFCYRVMPFGLKNAGATYQRTMTTLFHDMIHKEMEVYVDDIIIKSKKVDDHLVDLKKLFERLRKYNLKLNPAKCAFGAPAGKLLGFIVSKKGIEIDPAKIKAIRDMPIPKCQKDVKSFLGKINFIGRFIGQLTSTCEPLFKLLKKNASMDWNEDCQQAFDKIKNYLLNPPVLVPPQAGRPLIMYLSVLDEAVGCVLGQHDESGRKEQAIYYLSKKFTAYEANYSFLERSCCALAWAAQKLRHYLLGYTTYLISRSDPLKYLLEKSMPTGRMAKWQMILSEFDIVFTTQKAVKAQVIADHLAENPRDDDYQPLHTYFPDEEILFVGAVEDMSEQYPGWRLFFDGKHYPATAKLRFPCTNNMAEYEACIFGLKMALDMEIKDLIAFSDSDLLVHQTLKQWVTRDSKIMLYHCNLLSLASKFRNLELRHIPRTRNAFADALATLSSMIQHPDELVIEPIQIQLQNRPAHCLVTERVTDGRSWYKDIKEFMKTGSYPPDTDSVAKIFLRRMSSRFFLNGEVLYKKTSDLGLLRCINEEEADYMMKEVHSGVCGPHMNGHLLAKKIMRTGYFWLTMDMTAPWPCSIWGMDVIGTIDPSASNGHRFILVAIEYFTKWVEAASYKHVTKKVVSDFLRNNIICRFGVPETLITDNAKNLNNDMVDGLCEQFKIKHRNSAIYRPQMNGAVEAANKNLKKILMYGMEAVLPAEVEIPSLRILMEAQIEEAEWVRERQEQLSLIDEKRLNAVCHGQCYQPRMARAYNKKVKPRLFEVGDKVLKRILPMQDEAKGKFAPNWQGPFIVKKVLSGGALILMEMDGQIFPQPINADMCKKFFI